MNTSQARLVVVTGWTGAGKSTIADALAADLGATVASFDWLMSALRAFPDIWAAVELPIEHQREIGWSLLARVAEQQLRRGSSCVLDLVARGPARVQFEAMAMRLSASFHVVECICSDIDLHRARLEGRERGIPGWYELSWSDALRTRESYVPLEGPKLVLDAAGDLAANIAKARAYVA